MDGLSDRGSIPLSSISSKQRLLRISSVKGANQHGLQPVKEVERPLSFKERSGRMKKLMAVLLAAAMIISLGGCSVWDVVPTKGTNEETADEAATRESRGSEETRETRETRQTSEAATEEETQPETETQPAADEEPQNSGFYGMGAVARLGHDTFFVSQGLNNDASGNGTASSNDIYRINDLAISSPELVYSMPSAVAAGTEQDSIFYLASGNGRLWFMERRDYADMSVRMIRLDPDTLQTEEFILPFTLRDLRSVFRADPIFYDSGSYYFVTNKPTDGDEYKRALLRFDTADGSTEEIDLSSLAGAGSGIYPVTVSRDFLYYCVYELTSESWVNGIYRADLRTMAPEELASIDVENDLEDSKFIYAAKDYFYYEADDSIRAVRLSDGAKLSVLYESDGLADEYFPTWCIADDAIWFVSEEGLYTADPEGGNVSCLAEDVSRETKMAPVISGDWIWYSLNDHPEYARILKRGRIFPNAPLVMSDYSSSVKQKEDSRWTYDLFPNYARITGSKNAEDTLELPDSLEGLPVRSINCWSESGFDGVSTIRLPETLVACDYVYAKGVTRIELPKSIETFTHRGFTYSFRTDTETTFVYPGTLAEFEEVCRHSSRLYADAGIDANCGSTSFILECADGVYTCEPSPSGNEEFTEYTAEEDILITWLGIWVCSSGEKIEIDAADADTGLQLIYHGFTAAGGTFETAYDFAFENSDMTAAGEDKSVEQMAGWRYVLVLDPETETITMKSRYPDKIFTKQ